MSAAREEWFWILFGLVVCAVLFALPAHSAPFAVAVGDGVTVTLTDEPCALQAVTNLPNRATWTEKGEALEGCWGAHSGLVLTYFIDRTVIAIPLQVFQRAEGA